MKPKNNKISFYKIIQSLSIDVVIGVIVSAIFACRVLNLPINIIWLVILTLSTWTLYTLDHLIDGYKWKDKAIIFRHKFHYKYFTTLSILSIISGIIALILSIKYFDVRLIIYGLLLVFISLIYFTILFLLNKPKFNFLQKELIIAIIYVSGIWLAPIFWLNKIPNVFSVIIIIIFILLAWAEGIMASYFDYDNDIKENQTSFTVIFGEKLSKHFLIGLHLAILLIIIITSIIFNTERQLLIISIVSLMNFCLIFISLTPKLFKKNEYYRIFGEIVFWLPLLVLLVDLS